MGSWEMFVIPQKLFFFTGTRLLGVNTPVPDLPSIFTAPAPVRYFFLPSFPLHASHMTALSLVCLGACIVTSTEALVFERLLRSIGTCSDSTASSGAAAADCFP